MPAKPSAKTGKGAAKPGAKKGPSSAIEAIKKRREKELEEERKRKEEEEAEELRLKQEEEEREAARQAAEAAKKARKEEKEREAKAGGMTAAQKKKLEENRKKLGRMQISEAALARLEAIKKGAAGEGAEGEKKKKPQAETAAQKRKRLEREKEKRLAEEKDKDNAAAENAKGDDEGSSVPEDWEAEADEISEEPAKPKAPEGDEDSGDEESEESEEDEPATDAGPAATPSKHVDPTGASPKKTGASAKGDKAEDDDAELRSPICCVLGHVDTGKTKLLDYIRRTNVQGGESGGITQQIGASFFPVKSILEKTRELNEQLKNKLDMRVPGLLVIDTPGHESFTNLRSRGSALCDIAILVIDIMHGLEQQTIESIKLLKQRKCPFVVALNKIDRLYNWKVNQDKPFPITYKKQEDYVKQEFEERLGQVKLQLTEQGLNSEIYTKNKNFQKYVSLVPTSARTGEGIPDLLMLMVQLTQRHMKEKLAYSDKLQCTLLEVKKIEGHGMTIDVILVNGVLNEGDTILVCGLNGPIVTQIRALLTPHPLKEIRVKGEYLHHKTIKAAQGVKIAAQDLEGAVPGTPLFVVREGDDIDDLKEEVMRELGTVIKKSQGDMGVCVQASTLGALEALLSFLKDVKIPVSTVGVGPLYKKDMMRAIGIKDKNPKYAVVLAFDVQVTKEAQEIADKNGIKIFTADIIYHLEEMFKAYLKQYEENVANENKNVAVFPCHLKLVPDSVFMKKNPIVLGLEVVAGQLRMGTPLFTWKEGEDGKKYPLHVGKVESIEREHKVQKVAKKGVQVAVKIRTREENLTFGRQIDEKNEYFSEITRESIDALKESFRSEMEDDDWRLVKKLKTKLNIL